MRPKAICALRRIREGMERLSKNIVPLWHPLGFVSCVIFDENGVVTRLHYWPAGERRPKTPNWPIHTHLFKLSSLVVSGTLIDRQYHCSQGSDYLGYKVVYSDANSRLSDTGIAYRIEVVRESVLSAHGFYSIEEGVFHENYVDINQETLTLAQCFLHSKNAPIVLAPEIEATDPSLGKLEYVRQPFNSDVFWGRASCLIDKFLRHENGGGA